MEQEQATVKYDFIFHETASAWCVVIKDQKHWFSKQGNTLDRNKETITLPKWLAVKRGLV